MFGPYYNYSITPTAMNTWIFRLNSVNSFTHLTFLGAPFSKFSTARFLKGLGPSLAPAQTVRTVFPTTFVVANSTELSFSPPRKTIWPLKWHPQILNLQSSRKKIYFHCQKVETATQCRGIGHLADSAVHNVRIPLLAFNLFNPSSPWMRTASTLNISMIWYSVDKFC